MNCSEFLSIAFSCFIHFSIIKIQYLLDCDSAFSLASFSCCRNSRFSSLSWNDLNVPK